MTSMIFGPLSVCSTLLFYSAAQPAHSEHDASDLHCTCAKIAHVTKAVLITVGRYDCATPLSPPFQLSLARERDRHVFIYTTHRSSERGEDQHEQVLRFLRRTSGLQPPPALPCLASPRLDAINREHSSVFETPRRSEPPNGQGKQASDGSRWLTGQRSTCDSHFKRFLDCG